ncbi:MAG: tRNA (adenosine(37)-N6)-threonylcarbamoyltransferase complex transferase subunit TsaD [Bacillota bacterium]|nr:tRNA (adenosine(37)-N6)-threonylcarbamoyltransferase complex transferase subunit TsaD [Bacillota bacterium]
MTIFAIESSCDETSAAVVIDGRKVLSNIVASQIEKHKIYGGVVPEIASREHIAAISGVAREALSQAGVTMEDIDAVAVTAWPGLIGALLVGVNFAKGLALSYQKPLIPVHHIRGHVAANYIAFPELKPPFLALVVSGGHTNIIEVRDYTDYNVLGQTRDDAAGECFDKVARVMGLQYPGGVQIGKLAEKGDDKKYHFPSPSVDGEPLNFSFSGLKTAAINLLHNADQKSEVIDKESFSASFNRAVADSLVERLILAAEKTGYKAIVLAGGVSANTMLRDELKSECDRRKMTLYMPPLPLCGDNAAMIGSQGYYEYLSGNTAGMALNAKASKELAI